MNYAVTTTTQNLILAGGFLIQSLPTRQYDGNDLEQEVQLGYKPQQLLQHKYDQ